MKIGVLFSGGKDSTYAGYLSKKQGHELVCLMVMHSKNQESFMFHTPSIIKTETQAEVMGLPMIVENTEGVKEEELLDLKRLIKRAIDEFGIEGITTGALHSDYQAERIAKICEDLGIVCVNPLWHKDEIGYLNELLENDFKIIIVGVFAYPLNKSWLGRIIDEDFIEEVAELKTKYKIHPAGEGGEFETFVLNCPLFSRELKITDKKISSTGEHSLKMEIEVN